MPVTRTVWSATIAAVGAMTTGNAITATTAAREPTAIVMRNIIADIAVLVKRITNYVMTAATASRITANVTINAVGAMSREERSVPNAEKNVPSVPSGSVTNAKNVPTVRGMRRTVPTVISVCSVPSGSATAATAARGVPSHVRAAMKNVPTANRTRSAVNVRTVLTVWAVMKTSVKPVSYV